MMTHNSHNSSSTDNTETSTSGSASSPSKSLKTSSSLSPAKRSGSESPKNKTRGILCDNLQNKSVFVFVYFFNSRNVLFRKPDSVYYAPLLTF